MPTQKEFKILLRYLLFLVLNCEKQTQESKGTYLNAFSNIHSHEIVDECSTEIIFQVILASNSSILPGSKS